jgi:sulfate permease, SulP family
MNSKTLFAPKLLTVLKDYSKQQFVSDLMSGIIVGIVALPLAIAFGIASGVTPQQGLITAVVAGFLISALGGSRVQIGGPTGAFVVIVYGIVHKYGVEGLTVATLLAGILLMIMGLARMGNVIKFIPHPVTVGFTSGIALIIFSSQVKDFLGLSMGMVPAEFVEKWIHYIEHLNSINLYSLFIAIATVLVISFWPKVSRKIPGSVIALILFSAGVALFHLPVETIGSRFGDLPNTLPLPKLPRLDFEMIQTMIQPAFTIALLGGIESLLSAVVADGMIGGRHRSNTELIAQGIANIFSSLFGGIPATGAIARTATNVKNGGRTPIAGIIHSITLLLILLFLGKLAKLIPLACLAGILVVVAYHMSEWRSFVSLLRGPKSDVAVLITTFLLTVLVDLTVAIEIGMVLAAFLFMHRMSEVTEVNVITQDKMEGIKDKKLNELIKPPEGVEVYDVNGPLFFGVSHRFEEAMRTVEKMPKVRILELENVPSIDASGLHSLEQFFRRCKKSNVHLILSGVQPQPLEAIRNSGLADEIGEKNIIEDSTTALKFAETLLKN